MNSSISEATSPNMEEEEATVVTVEDKYEEVGSQIHPPPTEVPLSTKIIYRQVSDSSTSSMPQRCGCGSKFGSVFSNLVNPDPYSEYGSKYFQ